ncbi:hypothetical protein FKM82_028826, partial [Ascaphus truei]
MVTGPCGLLQRRSLGLAWGSGARCEPGAGYYTAIYNITGAAETTLRVTGFSCLLMAAPHIDVSVVLSHLSLCAVSLFAAGRTLQ